MHLYETSLQLRKALQKPRTAGKPIAFVPTMGYLHKGHAALIRRAAELADIVVVSVFVNPLQFGPNEDFERYPRNPGGDIAIAEPAGATHFFMPEAQELTPPDLTTRIDPGPLADALCGTSRPGHFAGVTTIVAKLLNVVQPSVAVFGWKDAQQLVILRKMAKDLSIPVQLEGVETVRERDGLALSSRNSYLTSEQRQQAPVLYRALSEAREKAQSAGEVSAAELVAEIRNKIESESAARIDYISIVRLDDLKPLEAVEPGNTMIALAAFLGSTRLIDNVRF